MYEFLMLLQRNNGISYPTKIYEPITKDEWMMVVKKVKRKSTSSIFTKRNYSLYKCAIGSERLTSILIKFYNAIIQS